MRKNYVILFLLAFLSSESFATHIVGGEIYYDQLSNNNYKITLKIYRDCFNGQAPYDNPATIFIFNSSGTLIDSVGIPFPGSVQLPVTINSPCYSPPTNICVEEAIYQTTVFLPPITGGYNIVYQRCCRNQTILNLINPGDVGSTYMAHIPDATLGINNSSPRYTNFPPIFLCAGAPLNFDHSATDPNGDSLYYELCDPFTGLDPACPILGTAAASGCPTLASPPPYAYVPWLSPYSASYPMSASPALAVDPNTGLMTGTPNMVGQWVVGVCVSEYRNGILLDVNKRDFQFNVVNCPGIPVASIPNQQTFCSGYEVNFSQTSLNASSYHWDFGDNSTTLDTSNLWAPTWTYADSGVYMITLIINPGTPCADTNTNSFHISPLLNPSFAVPVGECDYENSYNFSAGGDYVGNGTFTWNFGSLATPSTSNLENPASVVYNQAGIYPVTLTVSENGCTKSYTSNVLVYPKPEALFGLTTTIGCALNPVQFIDSSQADTPLSYEWDLGNGLTSTIQNPSTIYTVPGSYNVKLIITTQHGCKDTVTLSNPIIVYDSPIAGFSVTPTDTSIFYPDITMTDESQFAIDCSVNWGDGSTSNTCNLLHQYTHPGTFNIMQVVMNAVGCYDTAYSKIIIRPEFLFWIPNAFTPDNSGLNDVFKPKLLGVHNYKFLIFDRWGEEIFKTSTPEDGWNGYYKGRLCEQDVYVYKITFVDDVEQKHHQYIGRVTLVK